MNVFYRAKSAVAFKLKDSSAVIKIDFLFAHHCHGFYILYGINRGTFLSRYGKIVFVYAYGIAAKFALAFKLDALSENNSFVGYLFAA